MKLLDFISKIEKYNSSYRHYRLEYFINEENVFVFPPERLSVAFFSKDSLEELFSSFPNYYVEIWSNRLCVSVSRQCFES